MTQPVVSGTYILPSSRPVGPHFKEDWYPAAQLAVLRRTFRKVPHTAKGLILEFGCWEGRSTIYLANLCQPQELVAVDTWAGDALSNVGKLAASRDVFATFKANLTAAQVHNVVIVRRDCNDYAAALLEREQPVKFLHLDAAHDYASVLRSLQLLKPLVVPGGILCGDDFLNAHCGRQDLDGGVERAVREYLVGWQNIGNFWWWQRPPQF